MARRSVIEGRCGADPQKVALSRRLRRETTEAEDRLWAALRKKALGCRARNQHVIRGWIVDFYLPAAKLVIEVDGDIHDLQVEHDRRRTFALEAEGLRVIRFRNDDVVNRLDWVVARIATVISSA
ncbi:MAG: DUF559 domain-containing protein [Myxococcales bacterium]|nr:DUF559 domain-containing protein [Myxococcales bacterium]